MPVMTRVGQFFELLKNCQFPVLKRLQNQRIASSSHNPHRTRGFCERTGKEFGQFFVFLLIMKIMVICQIWLLENFEIQKVNGYMPRLIIKGYLSLTLRTTQHQI
jgi:hypothetical protein